MNGHRHPAPRCRPYQTGAVRWALKLKRGQRTLFVSPTGSGKTVFAANYLVRMYRKGNRILVVAERGHVVRQFRNALVVAGIPEDDIGEMMASLAESPDGRVLVNAEARVQVAGVQTLRNRVLPSAEVVVVDEAQHAPAKTYRAILDSYPDSILIGLTATPMRLDGTGLGVCFSELFTVSKPSELIEAGHLVAPEYWADVGGAAGLLKLLKGIRTRRGDYAQQELGRKMNKAPLRGDIVKHRRKHGRDLATVAFGSSVQHSKDIARDFRRDGITAEFVGADTPERERREILERLRTGETKVVCNYGILGEGWDAPWIKCIILARPTKSLALWIQQIGRGTRPYNGQSLVVLDHAGCLGRFKHAPLADREYTLDGKATVAPGEPPMKLCPECGYANFAGAKFCQECDHEFIYEKTKTEIIIELEQVKFEKMERERSAIDADLKAGMCTVEIAKKHGVSKSTIVARKKALGLVRPTRDWSAIDADLKGGMRTAEVAKKHGPHQNTIVARKKALGLVRPTRDWSAIDADLKGGMRNVEAAKKHGLHQTTIVRRKKALGLVDEPTIDWSAIDADLKGGMRTAEVTKKHGLHQTTIARRKKALGLAIDWSAIDADLKGGMRNVEAAKKHGPHRNTIAARKKALGLSEMRSTE